MSTVSFFTRPITLLEHITDIDHKNAFSKLLLLAGKKKEDIYVNYKKYKQKNKRKKKWRIYTVYSDKLSSDHFSAKMDVNSFQASILNDHYSNSRLFLLRALTIEHNDQVHLAK